LALTSSSLSGRHAALGFVDDNDRRMAMVRVGRFQ
jgi:hypothetical protein